MRGLEYCCLAAVLLLPLLAHGAPSVEIDRADWAPQPYDPMKPPPEAVTITPDEWFQYMSKMHRFEGIHCTEEKVIDKVYDFLREQMEKEKNKMQYERILGGLYKVTSPVDGEWYGFCLENVLSDGTPEAHPVIVEHTAIGKVAPPASASSSSNAASTSAGGSSAEATAEKRAAKAKIMDTGVTRAELQWEEIASRIEGNDMIGSCHCSCEARSANMNSSDPLNCDCRCPAQYGQRGVLGVHGPMGPRGPRGPPGALGPVGPEGLPGRLPTGSYGFDICDCYAEDWRESMNEAGWSECNKPGYLLQGLWRDDCDDIECAYVARCCRPCLKISDVPPDPVIHFITRQAVASSFQGMQPKDFKHIYNDSPHFTKGYCDRYLSDFFHESNLRTCFHKGSDKNIITKIVVRFYPKDTKSWQFRLGAEFDEGGIIVVDDEVWADGSGHNLSWGRDWDESRGGVLLTKLAILQPDMWHQLTIWGLSSTQTGGMDIQFRNTPKQDWTPLTLVNLQSASKAV